MKKFCAVLLAAGMTAGALAACGKEKPSEPIVSDIILDMSDYVSSDESSSEAASSQQDTSSDETSSKDTSSKETSSKDSSSKDTSSKDTSSKVTSSKDTSSKETSSKETSSKETSSKETSSKPSTVNEYGVNVAKIDSSKISALKKKNSDTIGWIKVPNTNIDYGVVQEPNSGYYLNRDYNKKYVKGGASVWADYACTFGDRSDLSKNTIVYGHNWTNCWRPTRIGNNTKDKWFAQLAAYDHIDFARENPYISFSTTEEEMYWQIFAVFYTDVNFYYIDENPADLTDLTDEAKSRSIFDFDVDVTSSDKILTLSTCTRVYGKRSDQRFVIMAKLMPAGAALKEVSVSKNKDFKEPQF